MTAEQAFPQKGDLAVDLRKAKYSYDKDRCGGTLTVTRITATLVITSDGERYNRERLHPVREGRYSDRELVPATHPRVLVIRGREHLTALAETTRNLAALDFGKPEDIVAALSQIGLAATVSRRAVIDLMAEASRIEQESDR
jgi:hypothetical protein